MEKIEEDINTMIKNYEQPEIPEDFVPPFPLTTDEIKKQTKQEGEDLVQMQVAVREEGLTSADEITDEENKNIIKSILNPMPGLLVCNEMDFQDIFLPVQQTIHIS